jgi:hypothetical protein
MAEDARRRELRLNRPEAQKAFAEMLCDLLVGLADEPRPAEVGEAIAFLELAQKLGIEAISARAQELFWSILLDHPESAPLLAPLAEQLGFARPREAAAAEHAQVEQASH